MSKHIAGNVNLRWFDTYPSCRCGKPARGVLMGVGNASYGPRCQSCADRELKAADKARAALATPHQLKPPAGFCF